MTLDMTNAHQQTFHLFQQYLDQELGEVRTQVNTKTIPAETRETIERMQRELNEQSRQIKAMQIAKSIPRTYGAASQEAHESKSAFNKALRVGPGALNANERRYVKFDHEAGLETKALYASDNTTGGFLTVPEYTEDLVKAITLISPMRQLVNVRETTSPYVLIPKRTQTASAYRISEQGTRTATQDPRFGQIQIFPYEAAALVQVSRTDLDDAVLDLGQFLMNEFGEQFAKLEGAELINGDGNQKAKGFLQDTSVTTGGNQVTTTSAAGVLDYQSFVIAMHALKSGYRTSDASWVMTTESLGAIRLLKDNQNRPLWQPFGSNDLPGTIYGFKYVEAPDMPQIASGAFAVAFGNFKKAYTMVLRKEVSVQVLQERWADQNLVGYLGYYRMGGSVVLGEAIKLIKIQ